MSNEREAFEEWVKSLGLTLSQMTVGEHSAFQAGAAYHRSKAQIAPAGYVMVPVKPTPEMLDCIMDWQKIGNVTAYRAMLAAAPKADVQEPVAWLWEMHGWLVTAHGKHRAIKRHVDTSRPPESTLNSDDFIRLVPLYEAPQPVSDDARDALVEAL